VTKAALTASLMSPGVVKVPAQEIAQLQQLLSALTADSTQRNVKVWILSIEVMVGGTGMGI
jgi:hypothetical protein